VTDDDSPSEVDVRAAPGAYEVGRGEHGVFRYQPYKDELLPLWTIRSLPEAERAAADIANAYRAYKRLDEFPGMDLARKYLRMGWTRSLRYAKYPGGQKYDDDGTEREPREWYDAEKRDVSLVYRDRLDDVRADPDYEAMRDAWRERYG